MAPRGWTDDGDPLSGGSPYSDDARRFPGAAAPLPMPEPLEQSSLVRPYAMTRGRTAPRTSLALEALVSSSTSAHQDLSHLTPEKQAIISMCRQVRSVAEIAALLRMPLGVARVVISDMEADRLVQVHHPRTESGKPDVNLLERVLSGLRRL